MHARDGYSSLFVVHSFIHSLFTLSTADLKDGRLLCLERRGTQTRSVHILLRLVQIRYLCSIVLVLCILLSGVGKR